MAILISYYRIGMGLKILKKFPNDHAFKFDVSDPDGWRSFLLNAKWNGKPLPRKDKDGGILFYRVFMFGGDSKGQTLYPGKDKKGNRKTVIPFGRLDISHKNYWKR